MIDIRGLAQAALAAAGLLLVGAVPARAGTAEQLNMSSAGERVAGFGIRPAVSVARHSDAVQSDIPGNQSTKATLLSSSIFTQGDFYKYGDSDWYRVNLDSARKNYLFVLGAFGTARLSLRDRRGVVIASSQTDNQGEGDSLPTLEVIPPIAGQYFLDATLIFVHGVSQEQYVIRYYADCAPNVHTLCSLKVGQPRIGSFGSRPEEDWFRINLDQSRKYHVDFSSNFQAELDLRDATGHTIESSCYPAGPCTIDFQTKKAGTYYVSAKNIYGDVGTTYTLSLSLR